MEKIPERLSKKFRGTRLFRDHIETIDKLFVNNFTKTIIYVGNFKYDNIEELLSNEKGRLYSFKIVGLNNNNNGGNLTEILSLNITGAETNLILLDKDDLKSLGVMKIIEDIIIQSSWFHGHLIVYEMIISIILSTILVYLLLQYSPNPVAPNLLFQIFYGLSFAFMIFLFIKEIDSITLFRSKIDLR